MRKFATMFLALLCFLTVKAQTTLVNEGFEVIPHSFTSSVTASVPDWDTTTALKYAGTTSLRGKVTATAITSVVTAKFVTTGYSKVYLRFKHICKLSTGDKGGLRVRTGGSAGTWTNVPKADTVYLTSVQAGDNGFLSTAGFNASSYSQWLQNDTNAIPTDSWWKSELFDLSYLIANKDTAEIQLRIQRGNTAIGFTNYGWLIDNFEIIGATNEIAPPVIIQQPVVYQDTIMGTGPWSINALITDASTVSTANFVYSTERLGVPSGPFTIPMTAGAGNIYTAEIPSMPYSTKITYHIYAADQYGNNDQTADKWFFTKRPPADVIVGTGTSTQRQPFSPYFGFERSASIYTGAEIGTYGTIATMAWSVATPQSTIVPTKIYLKSTTSTTHTADTWANLISGATLVYDASLAYTPTGWQTIDITDFNFTSDNIMVLCETNYGGSGTSTYPYFHYTTTSDSKHQYFNQDNSIPTGNGSLNTQRPNVTFGFIPIDVALDAGMNAVVEPAGTLIASSLSDVKVRIKCGGTTDLTSAVINWTIDGVSQAPYNWTGLLTQDQVSANLTLATAVNFAPGTHVIKVWTSSPNAGTDLYANNDTMQVSIYSCGGTLAAGTYTVGGLTPDFATLADVKIKLNTCGITGPVVFNVRPGTYYTSLELKNILGGSSANTVTIKSENDNASSVVILDTLNTNATLVLDSVSNFRLQKITLKTTAKAKNRLVWLKGRNVDVQFVNNVFEGLDTNLTSNSYALVYSSKGTNEKDSLLVFDGNTFKNGTYGLYLNGNSTTISSGITVQNNIFQSQAYEALYMYYNNNYTVSNNTITQSQNSTQSFYGIYLSYCREGLAVSKNKVLSKNLNYGLYLNYSRGTTTSPLLVSNNYIASSATTSTGYGMYVYYSDTTNFYYNTVNLNGAATASRAFYVTSGSVLDVRNNNFANNAGGFAYYIGTNPTALLSNYNNLYSSGAAIGYSSSLNRVDLVAWKAAVGKDTNSVSANPSFSSFDNFHTFELGLDGKAQPIAGITTDIEGQVRNASTPDIGCDEFEVAPINVGLISILQPTTVSACGSAGMTLTVRVKSAGSGAIDFATNNAVLNAVVTGPTPQNYTLTLDTGSLASGSTWDVTLTNVLDFSVPGTYGIKIWSTLAADTVRLNDTITSSYNFSKIMSYPYDVNFSAAPSPTWTITQLSGTVAWQYATGSMTSPTLAPNYGTGRLYFNSYTGSGSKSRATTPVLDFTGMTHPYLEFWMSQDNGYSSYLQEGVTVKISSDGGATWNSDTLFVQRYNSAYSTAGWKLFSKHMTSYANMSCVKIAFDAYSQSGNNLSIDRVVVRNLSDNDLKTNVVYTKGKLPVSYGTPDQVGMIVENVGALTQYNKVVTVDVAGANTQTLTFTIDSIQAFTSKYFDIAGLVPTVVGLNTVTAYVPNDDDNSNNVKTYRLESTADMFGYADTSAVAIKAAQANGLMLAKFKMNGTRSIRSVRAYINGGTTLNKVVYGVVLNSAGTILARSDNDSIVAADTAQWRTFTFPNWYDAILTDTTFFVGIAQVGTGYNPLGSQAEVPVRANTFYTCAALTGGALVATTAQGRFMIEAEIGSLLADEVALQAVVNPVTGCGLGNQAVTLNIKNNGTNNIVANQVTAWYSVNGGAAISLPVDLAIASGSSVNFSFNPIDFSATVNNVTYAIKAWVNLPADIINTNDTVQSYLVVSKPIPPMPTITSANPTSVDYNTPVSITAENPTGYTGNMNWYTTNVSTTSIGSNLNFTSGNLVSDTNFFTSFQRIDGFGVPVGTGNTSLSYIPFYYNYDYSWSSSIYKNWEIMDVGTIDTIWIQINSASTTGVINSQKVYLSTIADTAFANTDYLGTSGMTLVYDGNLTIPASGWLAVPLSTPYNYSGTGNLLVHWENMDGTYIGNPNPSFKSTIISNVAKYEYSDDAFPTTSGTMASSRTNMRFFSPDYGCVSPRVDVVVNIDNMPTVEVQPVAVTAPTSGCALHDESITVTVKNNLQTVAPIGTSIFCLINGTTLIEDTIDVAINVGQTIPFTFTQTYDFSAPTATTPYSFKVWTVAAGDTYTINDTINYSFESKWTATDLTLTDVTIPYGTSHTFTYPDWLRVYSNATATNQIFFGQNYPTPILYDTVTYWMEAVQANGTPMSQLIGTGTSTQTYVPFYYNYDYGWSAALYKRSEFASVGTIDTVWFQVGSASTTGMFANQKMYLSVVPDTVFAGVTQPDRNAMTLVFDGGLNIPTSGWIAVPLSAPFTYDGNGSLMMYWENREGSYSGNPSPSWASTSIANVAKYKYQDGSFPEGISGTTSSSRPNARFTGMDISCPSPLKQITVSVSGVPAQDAGVIRYNGPVGGSYLSATEHVSVTVKNYGTAAISNFPVSYRIGTGAAVTETFTGTLNTLDTAVFIFAANQDLSNFLNPLSVKAYTSLTGDNYATNDTIHGLIAVPVYCSSNATSPTTYMDLGNVTFAGINNGIAYPLYNNTTAVNGYTDFTQTVAPAYIAKGGNYPFIATQINNGSSAYQGVVKAYIDFNRNGVFDVVEEVFSANSTSSSTSSSSLTYAQLTASGNILIPASAQSGVARMRIVLDYYDVSPACGTYTYGETEDYTVIIYSATDPDAALTNYVEPSNPSRIEGSVQPIKVNLMNLGTTPITAATVKVVHNGTTVATQSWTGSLASLASVVDSVTSVTLVAGVNNFTSYVTLTGDNMHFNDTIRFVLNALPRYDVKPLAVLNPIDASCPNNNETIMVRITNVGQDTLFLATNNVLVKAQVLINDVAEYQTTVTSGIIPVNGTLDVPVTTNGVFATGGDYQIRAMVFLEGDGNLANDTLLTDTITINATVTALPAIEDFETFTVGTGPFPNDWTSTTNSTTANKYLWRANAGATLSGTASGPAVDHTLGNATGKYAYVYGGYGTSGDVSELISKCYNFVGVPGQANSVSFWYHMFNPGTNAKLYVEYGSGANWLTLDSLIGQQQTTQSAVWGQKLVTIPNDNRNGRIRFRAQKGTTAGDIAIDDINFKRLLPDVGISTIITPAQYPDSVMSGTQVTVKVRIHNYGLLPLDTVPVAYKIGTGAEILETHIGTIAAGGDVDYTFTATYQAPTPRTHYLCAYTKLVYDADTNNNKSCRNVTCYPDTNVGFDNFDVAQFNLSQNIPNPASDNAVIGFNMPQAGKVMFRVTDVLGKELYAEEISANQGANSVNLNTVNFATGMYYYWIEFKDKRLSKKMNIIK